MITKNDKEWRLSLADWKERRTIARQNIKRLGSREDLKRILGDCYEDITELRGIRSKALDRKAVTVPQNSVTEVQVDKEGVTRLRSESIST